MTNEIPDSEVNCEWALRRCNNLLKGLDAGFSDFEELAYNWSLTAVYGLEKCIEKLVRRMPDSLLLEYHRFLKDYLEPVDFKPRPSAFLIGIESEEEIDLKKESLRPKWIELYRLVNERLSSTAKLEPR
jgi:hypothetical protein